MNKKNCITENVHFMKNVSCVLIASVVSHGGESGRTVNNV